MSSAQPLTRGEVDYAAISRLCQEHLHTYGKHCPEGVGWFNKDLIVSRQLAMLGVIGQQGQKPVKILDVGCGTGALLAAMRLSDLEHIEYMGCDLSADMVDAARSLWPGREFRVADVLKDDVSQWPCFDYVVMSGVLTARCHLDMTSMTSFAQAIVQKIFSLAGVGIAFNTMSPYVDWKDETLFYWPVQDVCAFLVQQCSRHIHMRMDYGGYENTYYAYKERCIHEPM